MNNNRIIAQALLEIAKNSTTELIEDAKIDNEIKEAAKKMNLVLPSPDFAVFKTKWADIGKANLNKVRLPRKAVEDGIQTLVGKNLNFEHLGAYNVCGFCLSVKIKKDEIESINVFYKSLYPDKFEELKEKIKTKEAAVSFEIWNIDPSTKKSVVKELENGIKEITKIICHGTGLLLVNPPACPTAKVFHLEAKKEIEDAEKIANRVFNENLIYAEMAIEKIDESKRLIDADNIKDLAVDINESSLTLANQKNDYISKYLNEISYKQKVTEQTYSYFKLALISKAIKEFQKQDNWKCVEILNINHYGERSRPVYSKLSTSRIKTEELLIDGFYCLEKEDAKLVIGIRPYFGCFGIAVYSDNSSGQLADNFIDGYEKYAKENNFLKGEKITPQGKFLPIPETQFEDIKLEKDKKQAIKVGALEFFKKKDLYSSNKLPFKRGLIFAGEPGTGKTLVGKALINNTDNTFIWVTASDLMTHYGDIDSSSFGRLLSMAEELAPSILFAEDIDDYFTAKGSIDVIKTKMDGLNSTDGVVTILCTNYPEKIPATLIDRPSRFDDVIIFSLPDENLRYEILNAHLKNTKINNREEVLKKIAKDSEGLTGAHLKEVALYAIILASDNGRTEAIEEDFNKALNKVKDTRKLIQTLKAKKEIEEAAYDCECLECGKVISTDKHCKDIKCPECGGEMRRKDRPGKGQPQTTKSEKKEDNKVELSELFANVTKEEEITFDLAMAFYYASDEEQVKLTEDAAKWTRKFINGLPDSAFAAIEPAYPEKTDNKNARHLPHHNGEGDLGKDKSNDNLDLSHYKNALARANQIKPISDSISAEDLQKKASAHLERHKDALKTSAEETKAEVKPEETQAQDAPKVDAQKEQKPEENPAAAETKPEIKAEETKVENKENAAPEKAQDVKITEPKVVVKVTRIYSDMYVDTYKDGSKAGTSEGKSYVKTVTEYADGTKDEVESEAEFKTKFDYAEVEAKVNEAKAEAQKTIDAKDEEIKNLTEAKDKEIANLKQELGNKDQEIAKLNSPAEPEKDKNLEVGNTTIDGQDEIKIAKAKINEIIASKHKK